MIKKTTEQFIKEASLLHNNRYDYSKSEYIGAHDKIAITCTIHGEFWQTPRNHLFGNKGKGQGCPRCMDIIRHDNTRLTNKIIDNYLLENNIPIKRIGNYVNIITNIACKCLVCDNTWNTTPNHLKRRGGCPKCKDTRLTNNDIDNFITKHSLKIKRINDYINAYTKINWQCLDCNNIWLAQPCEVTRLGKRSIGSGCPECARGRNEKIVAKTLNKLNFKIKKLRIDLASGQKLFPDFYLPDLNLIIEYNGVQHYKPTCFGSMSVADANIKIKLQQKRDEFLRLHCKENQISLLEIDGRQYKGENLKKFVLDYFKNGVSND